MAGSPQKRQERERLVKQIDDLTAEIASIKRLCAAHAPHILSQHEGKRDEEAEPFSCKSKKDADELCKRIAAMAAQGIMESEMIANLAMTDREWKAAREGFPQVREALARARVRARAYYEGLLRSAIESNNNRVPLHAINAAIAAVTARSEQDEGGEGDASGLVSVDLRTAETRQS